MLRDDLNGDGFDCFVVFGDAGIFTGLNTGVDSVILQDLGL